MHVVDSQSDFCVKRARMVYCAVSSDRAAFQALHKACENARRYNYYPAAGSLSHTWIGYYLSEMTNEVVSLNEWLACSWHYKLSSDGGCLLCIGT